MVPNVVRAAIPCKQELSQTLSFKHIPGIFGHLRPKPKPKLKPQKGLTGLLIGRHLAARLNRAIQSGMRTRFSPLFCLLLCLTATTDAWAAPDCPAPKAMRFEVSHKLYRNVLGFTEGLEFHDHALYESTGSLGGGTRLLKIGADGKVTLLTDYGQKYFGEGLTFLNGHAYQLTWQDHLVFVYDKDFKLIRTLKNPHDGWGMTNDGRYLIYGDGSDHLYFADPETFAIKGDVIVRMGARPIDNINELEYVDGKIYANIWMTRTIVRLDEKTGCVEATAQMDTLWEHMTPEERDYTGRDSDFVLNGIAYDPDSKLFTVMGKEWPFAFAGRFVGE
jgi:glutamine cyclotransferase